jgi:transcriptional regulator with XRE-family HTH domain
MVNPELPSAADYAALGRALCVLRERAGLIQKDAAAKIGVRDTFISQVENGHRGLRWHTLLAFLDAYGADLHDLADAVEAERAPARRRRSR